MTDSPPDDLSTFSPEVLRLVEQLTDLLRNGKRAKFDEVLAANPEHADALNSVLPSIRLLNDFDASRTGSVGTFLQIPEDDPHLGLRGRLGDFQIVREIGRGGMGVVYEAEQLLLNRRVAIKVLPFAALIDERQRTRFQNESRAAATLNHPNIVSVYSVGVERGIHYFAMQYVEGQSLASLLSAMRLEQAGASHDGSSTAEVTKPSETVPLAHAQISTERSSDKKSFCRSVVSLGTQIAEALHHAHERGIIHRDIKPANVMLTESGVPMVTDFGLARMDDDSNLTGSTDIVGTLRYAPPEQVLGQQSVVDERADVYSLGATLFELLTLRPAFNASDREALLQQVTSGKTPRLRSIDDSIPIDLETIVGKATESDPADRYSSAALMAEDLRRFQDDRPLLSRRPGPWRRASKWMRRHPTFLAAVAAVFMFALAGISIAAWLINNERVRTNQERLETVAQRDAARENLDLALTAVDEMYSEIATTWISSDRDLSDTQMHFLSRAGSLFTEIAQRVEGDEQNHAIAGRAYLNAADTSARLMKIKEAEEGYTKARMYFEQELTDINDAQLRRKSAIAMHRLGDLHQLVGNIDGAKTSYQVAARDYAKCMESDPDDVSYVLPLLKLQYHRAHLATTEFAYEEVIEICEQLQKQLDDVFEVHGNLIEARTTQLSTARVHANALRRLGKTKQAANMLKRMLATAKYRMQDSQDNRNVLRTIGMTRNELAKCQEELQETKAAEENYRSALTTIRESFIFDGTPKEYSLAYMSRKASANEMEPDAFMLYATSQKSLGLLLLKTGRTDEAFVELDESVRSLNVLRSMFPENLHFAQACAESAGAFCRLELTPQKTRFQVKFVRDIYESMKEWTARPNVPFGQIAMTAYLGHWYARVLDRAGVKSEAIAVCKQSIELYESIQANGTATTKIQRQKEDTQELLKKIETTSNNDD